MKRICFLSPNQEHAHKAIDALREAGIPEKHLYVVAKDYVELGNLPDAGPEDDDFLPAYKRGLTMGGAGGLLAGLVAMAFPPSGVVIGGGALLLTTLFGAGVGGLAAGLVGSAFPSTRLEEFEQAIEAGQLLVLADVPADEIEKYEAAVRRTDPEIEILGVEPDAPPVP